MVFDEATTKERQTCANSAGKPISYTMRGLQVRKKTNFYPLVACYITVFKCGTAVRSESPYAEMMAVDTDDSQQTHGRSCLKSPLSSGALPRATAGSSIVGCPSKAFRRRGDSTSAATSATAGKAQEFVDWDAGFARARGGSGG